MLTVTIASVLCSAWATLRWAADARDSAAAALQARGAILEADLRQDTGVVGMLVPRSRFRRVRSIHFKGITEWFTNWHGGQPWYGGVSLTEARIRGFGTLTQHDIDNLCHFPEVEDFSVAYWRISSSWQSVVAHLPHVRRLNLSGSDADDAAIAHLAQPRGIEWLDLEDTRVTDGCVAALLQMKNIEYLNVGSTELTTRGILRLRELAHLTEIRVSGSESRGEIDIPRLKDTFRAANVVNVGRLPRNRNEWIGSN